MSSKCSLLLAGALLGAGCSEAPKEDAQKAIVPLTQRHGSAAADNKALTHPYAGLDDEQTDRAALGKSFFRIPWVEAPSATTARDGLGPLFNANTCIHCHPHNGTGTAVDAEGNIARGMVFRFSVPRDSKAFDPAAVARLGFSPDPVYGAQLSVSAVHGVAYEGIPTVRYSGIAGRYPDGASYTLRRPAYTVASQQYGPLHPDTRITARVAPALVGMGLLESVNDEAILAREDPDDRDRDGISGRANRVFSPETNATAIGRYTWKASAPTVRHQVAAAMHNDMGLTTPLFAQENCTPSQEACLKAPKGRHAFDAPQARLDAVAFYVNTRQLPLQRGPEAHRDGEALFKQIGCVSCHADRMPTREGNVIRPFTDLLLHDMGEGLSDGRSEFAASGREWRTAPLWGIGLRRVINPGATYLHDGRARSLEEAILWHGGEAEAAQTAFMRLDREARRRLILFLESI